MLTITRLIFASYLKDTILTSRAQINPLFVGAVRDQGVNISKRKY